MIIITGWVVLLKYFEGVSTSLKRVVVIHLKLILLYYKQTFVVLEIFLFFLYLKFLRFTVLKKSSSCMYEVRYQPPASFHLVFFISYIGLFIPVKEHIKFSSIIFCNCQTKSMYISKVHKYIGNFVENVWHNTKYKVLCTS